VVIDHPLKRRKIEVVDESRRRERIPKLRSKRKETVIETVDTCVTNLHTVFV